MWLEMWLAGRANGALGGPHQTTDLPGCQKGTRQAQTMSSAAVTCSARPCRGAVRSAFVRSSRPRPLLVRASKEKELERLAEFQKGLSQRLQSATAPSAAASEGGAVATEAAPEGKHLREVSKENFYEVIKENGDAGLLTVVDCFTEWCGPCKMILPTLVEWATELEGKVEIVKFNCNKHNKDLGLALGIKVAPTFLLYRDGKQVASMTGAKTEQLRELIETHM